MHRLPCTSHEDSRRLPPWSRCSGGVDRYLVEQITYGAIGTAHEYAQLRRVSRVFHAYSRCHPRVFIELSRSIIYGWMTRFPTHPKNVGRICLGRHNQRYCRSVPSSPLEFLRDVPSRRILHDAITWFRHVELFMYTRANLRRRYEVLHRIIAACRGAFNVGTQWRERAKHVTMSNTEIRRVCPGVFKHELS